jgi:hypothetical protein
MNYKTMENFGWKKRHGTKGVIDTKKPGTTMLEIKLTWDAWFSHIYIMITTEVGMAMAMILISMSACSLKNGMIVGVPFVGTMEGRIWAC